MKKILTVVGARPQFVKAAMISRLLDDKVEEVMIHTGQHFDKNMSEIFFEEMNIPSPKYNLGISGGTHAEMTAKMLVTIEKVLIDEKPDIVLLYGDTNSTLAGAISAVKVSIPIVHVEAGNRMGSLANPEEVNRICTDHVSSLLFAPTEIELKNLIKENLGDRAYISGNIMYDAFCRFEKIAKLPLNLLTLFGKTIKIPPQYYYMTCHRQENTKDEKVLREILLAMEELPYPTIYPVHPRNQTMVKKIFIENTFKNIIPIEPIGYIESIALLKNCEKVVTDSGGLQTEAFFAKKQCVTIFEKASWPQTLHKNRNQLAHPFKYDILEKLNSFQDLSDNYQPFGNGHAAEYILEKILDKFF